MKPKILIAWTLVLAVLMVLIDLKPSMADISICGDTFTVTGFLRYELGIHTAGKNPNNVGSGNYDFTLSRTFLQTEWTLKPSDVCKLYAKVRVTGDQTYHIDDGLHRYDAFPINVPKYKWTMMEGSKDDFRAEVWELYADLSLRNLWLRLGKQQIVWGEMIATRLMDVINPLDFSWNMLFEPEEFENIRIPNWSIRGIYSLGQKVKWVNDLTIEAFVNPGDVLPNQFASFGAPFNTFPPNLGLPPFFRLRENDNRGKTEYGFRCGGMIRDLYLTLNYLHVYSDDFQLKTKRFHFIPFGFDVDLEYPEVDIYGLTFNYFLGGKINTVITFEGTWVPNQPYGDALALLPDIRDQGTYSYAVRLNRLTFLLPRPTSAMDVMLQFTQTVREGDNDRIRGPGNAPVDSTDETITFQIRQPLWHNNIEIQALLVYDLEDAYLIKPFIKYVYGDHWIFDVSAVFLGGSEDRPTRFGSLSWGDEVFMRTTFQF